ncbi:MAG: hypothetical protein AB1715_13035 [Acidobacteriota bacterium]
MARKATCGPGFFEKDSYQKFSDINAKADAGQALVTDARQRLENR